MGALAVNGESCGAIGRLDSWKEIAAYLKRGARTVQRWEREEGLPVRRLQHGKLGSVYCYKPELDAWWAGRGEALENAPGLMDRTPSVAVMPFADMSPAQDQAYFCDGVAEEIIHALSQIQGLRAASRSSSFRFRTPGLDSRQIGRQLGVRTLLEGSVRMYGDQFRIAVQLVDTETGFQLWSERYDRQRSDMFRVQDEIAGNVAQSLAVALTLAAPKPPDPNRLLQSN
jgi:TolB-like protein